MKKNILVFLLVCVFFATFLLSGCANMGSNAQITLKLFSNLPDRNNGQGLIEQMLIDQYENTHPNVKIEVEALEEKAYKTKFKAYAMDGMPDIVSIWGQPSFLDDILEAGLLAELNINDYSDYDFLEGALDGFMKDSKLYGLPRNTDMIGFYYDKSFFEAHGFTVPSTYEDFLSLCSRIYDLGVTPVAMAGGDGWPLVEYYDDLLYRVLGKDRKAVIKSAISNADFSDEGFTQALSLLKNTVENNVFQPDFTIKDYGSAMSLFTTGGSAMYYMGSWEASMAINEDIPKELRNNIEVFMMPSLESNDTNGCTMAWYGGGYAVSASSPYTDEAIDFLNFCFSPDHLSAFGWENGVGMSAQDQSKITDAEATKVQKYWLNYINAATDTSGTPINDCGSSEFKNVIENEIGRFCTGIISADEFLNSLEEACR